MEYRYRSIVVTSTVDLVIVADDLPSADQTMLAILGSMDDPDLDFRANVDRAAYEFDFHGTHVTFDPSDVESLAGSTHEDIAKTEELHNVLAGYPEVEIYYRCRVCNAKVHFIKDNDPDGSELKRLDGRCPGCADMS